MITESKSSDGSKEIWKEFLWGGLACAFGETVMHPVDTLKTRLQSGMHFSGQRPTHIGQVFKTIWTADGFRGLYRGVLPGITGSFVTGATYFGFIESTKDWLQEKKPSMPGPWALFVAGAAGDALGAVVYVPCEVIKQRMQVQGSPQTWSSVPTPTYQYYTGILHAAKSIHAQEGITGIYAGLLSTLVRDIPFAGLQIVFYEALRKATKAAYERYYTESVHEFSSPEEFLLGGAAGGISAFLTTPLDVIKTRMQVQSTGLRYKGWVDAVQKVWKEERVGGFFKGCGPRVMWWCPASALTFMAVEKLRKEFNAKQQEEEEKEKGSSLLSGAPVTTVPHPQPR